MKIISKLVIAAIMAVIVGNAYAQKSPVGIVSV